MRNSPKSYINWLGRLIGIFILVIILKSVDFSKIAYIISTSNKIFFLFFAFPLAFLVVGLRFYRWLRIGRFEEIIVPFWEGTLVYFASFGLGIITPGRIGEFIKVNYLKNQGYSLGKSFFTTLLDRIIDVAIMVFIALGGIFIVFPPIRPKIFKILLLILFLLTAFIYLVWKNKKRIHSQRKNNLNNFWGLLINEMARIPSYIQKINWKGKTEIFVITFLSWIIFYFQNLLFSEALGVDLSYFQIVVFVSIASLISLVPISISGLGTRDAALIYLFSLYGIDKEFAILFSGCMFLNLIFLGIVSFIIWETAPIRNELIQIKRYSK